MRGDIVVDPLNYGQGGNPAGNLVDDEPRAGFETGHTDKHAALFTSTDTYRMLILCAYCCARAVQALYPLRRMVTGPMSP